MDLKHLGIRDGARCRGTRIKSGAAHKGRCALARPALPPARAGTARDRPARGSIARARGGEAARREPPMTDPAKAGSPSKKPLHSALISVMIIPLIKVDLLG